MTTKIELKNPLLEAYKLYVPPRTMPDLSVDFLYIDLEPFDIDQFTNQTTARYYLSRHCAYAVPDDEAIYKIAELDLPIVEIGAGTGYWAWLLKQAGVEIYPFDYATSDNYYCSDDHWTEVTLGTASVLGEDRFKGHALMLCWPPFSTSMAEDCLKTYQGDTLIYIGEDEGGCTATHEFFNMLDNWEVETTVYIPQWPHIRDGLTIYRR